MDGFSKNYFMLMNSFMGKDKRLWDDRKNARGTELKKWENGE